MNSHLDVKPRPSSEPNSDSQVALLRSRVEAELKKPAVVLVTSAHEGDGTSLTASSLATSFAKSGHRAALVGENTGMPVSDIPLSERSEHGRVTDLELPPESDDAVSREGLAAFVEAVRSDFDYTIVDGGTFLDSNSAMALPRLVDGILLTVRVGRASSTKDEMMVRMIEHLGSTVVGVVATDPAAIAEFEREPRRPSAENGRVRHADRNPARALVTTVLCTALFAALNTSSAATRAHSIASVVGLGAQVAQATVDVRDAVTRFAGIPLLVSMKD